MTIYMSTRSFPVMILSKLKSFYIIKNNCATKLGNQEFMYAVSKLNYENNSHVWKLQQRQSAPDIHT